MFYHIVIHSVASMYFNLHSEFDARFCVRYFNAVIFNSISVSYQYLTIYCLYFFINFKHCQ